MNDTLVKFCVLSLVFLPFLLSPLFLLKRLKKRGNMGLVFCLQSAVLFAVVLLLTNYFVHHKEQNFSIPWIPSAGVNLTFLVDGLSLFFSLLVTGMGALVAFYSNYYMEPRDPDLGRFYCYLSLFMGSMLGAVLADNLLLMFVFWELTGVSSFLLISYHYREEESRKAARMAILVTGITGLFLLVGIIFLGVLDETFVWTEMVHKGIAHGRHPFWSYVIISFFMIGIFGKSAQIPFHFWLPKAMAAPTPVSAYLHSATMVKLGIYLTARMYPLFVEHPFWFPALTTCCFCTMLLGAVLSLLSNDIKAVLAYATVSQLGFFIGFYGMGDSEGLQYDFIHILNHALYKGSLFMLAGYISHATGIRDIRYLGGLWKKMPFCAAIFLISVAAMAGIPGTTGFLSKELIISDVVVLGKAHQSGWLILLVLIFAMLFKVAFSIRLFYHLFMHRQLEDRAVFHLPDPRLLISPLILSSFAFLLGLWPKGLQGLAETFYVSGLHKLDGSTLELWHGWTMELGISLTILGLGTSLFLLAEKGNIWWLQKVHPGLAGAWEQFMDWTPASAGRLTAVIHGTSPARNVALIFILFSAGIGGTLLTLGPSKFWLTYQPERDSVREMTIIMMLIATISIPFFRENVSRLVALSISGFFITLYFALNKAPDLALTQLLIEVVTLFVLLAFFSVLGKKEPKVKFHPGKALVSLSAGLTSALVVGNFNGKAFLPNLKEYYLANSWLLAKGKNVVNTIIVDFRGLDTLGEVSVLIVVALGLRGMLYFKHEGDTLPVVKAPLIPSVILRTLVPYIYFLSLAFALYLLLRGHHNPGGGFIAGLVVGISYVLIAMTRQLKNIRAMFPIPLLMLTLIGLAVVWMTGFLPMLFGYPFLTSWIGEIPLPGGLGIPYNTPLLFDIGIFCIVVEVSVMLYYMMRRAMLAGGN